MLHPDYLRNHLAALNADLQIGASFTFWDFIDETDALLRRGCDVGTATPQLGPFLRYLWSAALAIDLGPMHGVYRRSYLCDLPLRNCPACDHILLSNCFYLAPFKCIPGHLYKLREFDESKRSQNVMQRRRIAKEQAHAGTTHLDLAYIRHARQIRIVFLLSRIR